MIFMLGSSGSWEHSGRDDKQIREHHRRKRRDAEEAGRIQKQVFDLENLRVLSWAGLVKLVWMTMWTYGLLCILRLKAKRLYEKILAAYPAFAPVPRFPYYRVAGGLALLLLVGALTDPGALLARWKTG